MATDKEQVQEFLSIAKESVDEYVAGIDFAALSAAKQLILAAEAKGNRLHVTASASRATSRVTPRRSSAPRAPRPMSFTAPSAFTAPPARPGRATS